MIRERGYKLLGERLVRWCERCKPDGAVPGRPIRKGTTDNT
jgi:hypothetical protein